MKTILDQLIELNKETQRLWRRFYVAIEKSREKHLCLPEKTDNNRIN